MRLLVGALLQPERLGELELGDWDLLLRQARPADLLARLAILTQRAGVWERLPSSPRGHLASALLLAQRQHVELRHEVRHIAHALAIADLPVVILKGAAYVMQGRDAGLGRMVSDVDILVSRERIVEAESALMMAGWVSTHRDAYDQRYYRQWMHEVPPLRHMERGTVLDLHHAILPLTARLRPDTTELLRAAERLDERDAILALCREDQVLHSAAHLFHEGELEMGLRGLVDLDALLRESAIDTGFWESLLERAIRLQLQWPLYLALRYAHMILNTPVPDSVWSQMIAHRSFGARRWRLWLFDVVYSRALRPMHASLEDAWTPLARFLLYLRSHWIRMPPHLLAWHLLRKSLFPTSSKAVDP